MADPTETIQKLFDQQAVNYSNRDIEGMLAHYAPDGDLLFWSSEGGVCSSHDSLRLWYEALFGQFEILSVGFRIESAWQSDELIGSVSIWQFETCLSETSMAPQMQSLRATHLLRKYDGYWKIAHIHSSPTQASADS
ncbi:MAG: YybH family protein [Endozoicomonas sp.]